MRAISAAQAAALDTELMSSRIGFDLSTLVELAGQSVSTAITQFYPVNTHRRAIVACGPGNNGSDGLVTARYLAALGYAVNVVVPALPSASRSNTPSAICHSRALAQLALWNVGVFSTFPKAMENSIEKYSHDTDLPVIVDAVFGFSFVGTPRHPFDTLLTELAIASNKYPVVSIDTPSGWPVDAGLGWRPNEGLSIIPKLLVSLTAPKFCAAAHKGPHFLGLACAIVPPQLCQRYGIDYTHIDTIYPATGSSLLRRLA